MYNTARMPSNENSTRRPGKEWAWITAASLLVVAVASVPYLLAYWVPPDHVFTGILVNPADGNSYFAKMREGWRGEWLFTLPYTPRPSAGALIFTYYLFLGHLARWAGASLDLVYGLARALGGLALLLSAYAFVSRFVDSRRWRLLAWLLFALGSGVGWLAVPFGAFTSDLWVAEAIPFLSVFVNAHFALATALLLWILGWTVPGLSREPASTRRLILIAVGATVLAQVQPLALLNVGLTLAAVLGRELVRRRLSRTTIIPALVFGVCAAPWLLYDAFVSRVDPTLAQWNAQNLTPSPPLWDLALSGGIPLALAIVGLVVAIRRRTDEDVVLVMWLALGGLALYAPFALQRRLSFGLWMPLILLAVIALREGIWPRLKGAARPLALAGLAVFVLPSNLLVYAATLAAVQRRDPAIFLTRPEAEALGWLVDHAAPGAVVAAAPQMSLFIPARTDARVVYGHPFETVDAAAHKQVIEEFYSGQLPAVEFVHQYGVAYVLLGDRERLLGSGPTVSGWPKAFVDGAVVIYAP
jgi:hypothetical protein